MTVVTVVRDALVRPDPEAAPLTGASVVIRHGVIEEVGRDLRIPAGATVVDAGGATVVAGFWNCHVHLTTRSLAGARRRDPADLGDALGDLVTGHGFTTVADLASDPRNTMPLRARVEAGEVPGPRIYTAGAAVHPHRGLPFYTKDSVPRCLWWALPTPRTPRAARAAVRRQLRAGAELTKLFTGSYVTPTTIKPMRTEIARAAAEVAHEHGALVFAHTSDREGLQVALDAGVDVIAHVPDETEGVGPLLRRAADTGVWMVPTLQMFARTVTESRGYLDPIEAAAREFVEAGGRMLFGTDVGYMADPTIGDEIAALGRCGLSAADILRMLTSGPAEAFGVAEATGRVAAGHAADLVLLDGDPWTDLSAFGRVRSTIRAGAAIWTADPPPDPLR